MSCFFPFFTHTDKMWIWYIITGILASGYIGYLILLLRKPCISIRSAIRNFIESRRNTEPTAHELRDMQANIGRQQQHAVLEV